MAKKTLVVVESPAKAKTINKYLGPDFIVEASVGHIKDLSTYRLGVDIKNNFEPKYTTIKGKADVIKKIKQLAEKTENVLIATDPDREGEAIAWHIAEEVKTKNPNIKRVLFNEITKTGIQKGLNAPLKINESLFMSQQARRVMDRIIGYQVSPFLMKAMIDKTADTLSAGRVQSVALRLICERESEIQSFVPIDYWNIMGTFRTGKKENFKARLVSFDGKSIKNPEGSGAANTDQEKSELEKKLLEMNYIKSEAQAEDLIARIKKESYTIKDVTKKTVRRNPSPPFTTSSLQQEASKRLGFSNKKTMSIAQQLYEGVTLGSDGSMGLITYMRTDSVRLSPEAQQAAHDYINKQYGSDYAPEHPPQYSTKSANVQDAHEAIRPTSLQYLPKDVRKHLTKDQAELYELVFNRFVASQMSPAIIDQTTVNIAGGNFIFRASGSVVAFKGFLAAYDDINEEGSEDKETAKLPEGLDKGKALDLAKLEALKSQTKPKPRYTEASLVKELDERGIGRPSTYAAIVSTLVDRKYVELTKKAFYATPLGMDVNVVLTKNFPELFNVDFTALMEQELDHIADGDKTYLDVMTSFYGPFKKSLDNAEGHNDIPEIPCELCGAPMMLRVSRRGRFLGCSRYPECKNTKPLPAQEKKEKQEPDIHEDVRCDICGKAMILRDSRYGKFFGCIDYPKCKGTKPFTTGVKCPKCHEGELAEKFSPKSKKKFWGCSRYPDCDYITNYEPVNKECPNCHNYFINVHYRKKGSDWEKYLKCPECKESFEIETPAVEAENVAG